MINFTRTFHPVGQGAFYSEEFELPDYGRFRMVYDCGSKSLSESDLKKRINSDFAGDIDVDILFISHFDEDHTNRVKYLKPKTVVLPFLSEAQILLLTLCNMFQKGTYDIDLAKNPAKTFPGAQIIQILPDGSDSESDFEPFFIQKTKDTSNRDDNSKNGVLEELCKVKSLVPIKILHGGLFWKYISYNPNWDKYVFSFKTEIDQCSLDWAKLLATDNGDYIMKHLPTLNEIYDRLKPKNLHYLVVCSNSTQEVKLSCYAANGKYCLNLPGKLNIPCGCIYYGDAEVRVAWRNIFYGCLQGLVPLQRIGTLQVPHHGSYLSKGENIIPQENNFANPVLCIISVGEFNHFGHPSVHVITELQKKMELYLW